MFDLGESRNWDASLMRGRLGGGSIGLVLIHSSPVAIANKVRRTTVAHTTMWKTRKNLKTFAHPGVPLKHPIKWWHHTVKAPEMRTFNWRIISTRPCTYDHTRGLNLPSTLLTFADTACPHNSNDQSSSSLSAGCNKKDVVFLHDSFFFFLSNCELLERQLSCIWAMTHYVSAPSIELSIYCVYRTLDSLVLDVM